MKRGCAIFLMTCFLALAGLAENHHLSKAKAEQILREWLVKRTTDPQSSWWKQIGAGLAIGLPQAGSVLSTTCQKENLAPLDCVLRSQKNLQAIYEAGIVDVEIRERIVRGHKYLDFTLSLTEKFKATERYEVKEEISKSLSFLLATVLSPELISVEKITPGYAELPASRGALVTFTYKLSPSLTGKILKREVITKVKTVGFINPGGRGWEVNDQLMRMFGEF